MEGLSDELISAIIGWVPPLDVLLSLTLVSKRFARQSALNWQSPDGLLQSGFGSVAATDTSQAQALPLPNYQLNNHQLQRCCIFRYAAGMSSSRRDDVTASRLLDDPSRFTASLRYDSVLPSQEEAAELLDGGGYLRVCAASTTDHTRESIENVLRDQGVQPGAPRPFPTVSWWSSRPSPSTESSEVLLFATKYPLALISRVSVKPLRDPYQRQAGAGVNAEAGVYYTWKTTVIRAYHLPLEALTVQTPTGTERQVRRPGFPCVFSWPQTDDGEQQSPIVARTHRLLQRIGRTGNPQARVVLRMLDDEPASDDQDTIDALIGSHTPVFELQDSNVPPNSDETLTYQLSTAERSVVANVITITLIGKNREQHPNSGYFACVEHVDCDGIPLYTNSDNSIGGRDEDSVHSTNDAAGA